MGDAHDWIVIGGGIHGVHLAVRLLGEAGVAAERLRIVDPAPQLLASWRRCAANTGMRHLRSPAVHQLGLDPWSLLRFAGAKGRGRKPEGRFAPPYDRPSVEVFEGHCDALIAEYGLADRHVRAAARGVDVSPDGVEVQLSTGASLHARHALLAMGASDQPRWPDWASRLREGGALVHHIFERDFVLEPDAWPASVAVVGGGITAAQVAMRMAEEGREVHLLARHGPREHQFDADPGWVGPKRMRGFAATKDRNERRQMIRQARHAGSVPPDVNRALRRAIQDGRIQFHQGEPEPIEGPPGVALRVGGRRIVVEGMLLATGFEARRPGGSLVDGLIERHALPCAECGYPMVDTHLRWHPRVFVTGPLAELEIGPVARNIVGARRAADRIVPLARTR